MDGWKRVIKESGLTRAQLARDAGLSEAALWSWWTGTRSPTKDSLVKMADGLGVRALRLQMLSAAVLLSAGLAEEAVNALTIVARSASRLGRGEVRATALNAMDSVKRAGEGRFEPAMADVLFSVADELVTDVEGANDAEA